MEFLQAVNAYLLNFGIEWQVVVAQAIGFVVLLASVWRVLFKPIAGIMRRREEQIANSLAHAEAEQLRAESLRKDYESRLTEIADEAHARFEQAMKDAETERQHRLEQAQAEIRDLYQRHEKQLDLDREQLRRDLRGELSDIAVEAAAKALRGQMTPTIQSAVVDQVIRELALDASTRG